MPTKRTHFVDELSILTLPRVRGRFRGTCRDCFPNRDTLVLPGDVELPPGLTIPGLTDPSSEMVCSCRKKDGSTVVGTALDLSMYAPALLLCRTAIMRRLSLL